MTTGNSAAPTSTVMQSRVALFQPSQRPVMREGEWMVTSFGRCRVVGRLGQRHADVLESIMYCAERRRNLPDGGVELLVDPASVRRKISDGHYSHEQIGKLLIELRAAVVTIESPRFDLLVIGGLIDHVVQSTKTRHDPLTGGQRHLSRVRLGYALVLLLEHDLKLYYDPGPIARMVHGVSQAVARHLLSHKTEPPGGWFVDTVIRAVLGQGAKGKAMRDARHRLKEDLLSLRALGLVVHGDRVRKRGAEALGVAHPPDSVALPPESVAHSPGASHSRPV